MRVTIVVNDNLILVDGEYPETVDCSALKADGERAVQWYGDHGEVEFNSFFADVPVLDPETNEPTGATIKVIQMHPNLAIDNLTKYQPLIDQYQVKRQATIDKEAADAEAIATYKPDLTKMQFWAQAAISGHVSTNDAEDAMGGDLPHDITQFVHTLPTDIRFLTTMAFLGDTFPRHRTGATRFKEVFNLTDAQMDSFFDAAKQL